MFPTQLGPLTLSNPIIASSGTFSYGCNDIQARYRSLFGAVTAKTITLLPRKGNPLPRIHETPSGVLNSIGLENVGINAFLAEYLPQWNTVDDIRLIVSVGGDTVDDYVRLCRQLHPHHRIDAIELNISCPNVKKGGMAIGGDLTKIQQLLTRVKQITDKPCIVKLSPNVANIIDCAQCCEEHGADIISLVNCFLGMAIDVKNRRPLFANTFAGLSGPAIRPIALRIVYQIRQHISLPIIGIGGITTAHDAMEFLIAGATAVAIGTANLISPHSVRQILEGLALQASNQKASSPFGKTVI